MTTLAVLRAARELISDESRWCQGAAALDAAGEPVRSTDVTAARWCALGALGRVSGADLCVLTLFRRAARALEAVLPELGFRDGDAAVVNDAYGHAAVLRMYDRAIERAEAEQ